MKNQFIFIIGVHNKISWKNKVPRPNCGDVSVPKLYFKMFVFPYSIYVMYMRSVDLGRPGDTFAVAGDRAI